MFILCKLILAALAVSLVMAVDDGEFVLKPCAGGVFEETYFNFDIYIDHFSEECDDFEKMSEKIQLMIEKVEMMIPEYEDEFIDAEVCSLPTFVGRRRLAAKRTRGTYSFAGAGGCKRCTASKTDRRNLQAESFEKRVCETLLAWAAVDAAVAERAAVKAKEKLEEILARAVDKETREYLDERETDQFVKNAEKELEECKETAGIAKAKVLFFETACKSADFASVEDQQGFEIVANEMDKDIHKGAKDAQKGFYNVKDEDINLKTEIVKSKFHKKEEEFKAEVSNLETELEAECNKLREETTRIQQQIKIAKKARNKTLETELLGQIEALNHQAIALEDEFDSFTELMKETIDHDFELALGIIHAEAANTFEDYMQAFAELMTKGLEGYLKLEDEFSSCFEKEPKVEVTINSLEDETDKEKLLKGCPKAV
jgi:hypothetical protein